MFQKEKKKKDEKVKKKKKGIRRMNVSIAAMYLCDVTL